MSIILASASPRRHDLLNLIGLDHRVISAAVDESLTPGLAPDEQVRQLARRKAAAVAAHYPKDTIIAADTIVVLDDKIYGKPQDEADAARMLGELSGRTHQVYTGVAVRRAETTSSFAEMTEVTFYPLSAAEITAYIATGEPLDKAGAYGIQGYGAVGVRGIVGDYFNVMGLPVARLVRELRKLETPGGGES